MEIIRELPHTTATTYNNIEKPERNDRALV